MKLVRIENADREAKFLGNDPDWFRQIGVVRYQDSNLKLPGVGIAQEMGRQIDVRPFSSVLSTQTFCAGSKFVRYIGTECVRKWPYLIWRFGIVLSARM